MWPAYISIINLDCALLKDITSKGNGDFYCVKCVHSFRTENKLKSHENMH